ncbi:MAG TPA: PqqD family protein [Streptosporangiaceae bacterium]|nr:PqqD family protein [Streptosporangiaceae bacterium]
MTDRPVLNAAVEINPGADGYVIYDPETDRVHYANHTAALVLELCNGENTVADIATALEAVYPSAGRLGACVSDCVGTLRAEGIVHPAPAAADVSPS